MSRLYPRAGAVIIALAVIALSCGSSAPVAAPALLISLPGDDNQFSPFDFRQGAEGPVDWPVTFVFRGNASIERVKQGLCSETQHPWSYCDKGGSMYLFAHAGAAGPAFDGYVGDGGVKRFGENCSSNAFTAHMRLYAPPTDSGPTGDSDSFSSSSYGHLVLATVHLDFQDKSGCAGRVHGYSDVAEAWFIETMKTIPGWEVRPDSLDLGNANETFVILRDVGGVDVPHVYENDQFGTEVIIT